MRYSSRPVRESHAPEVDATIRKQDFVTRLSSVRNVTEPPRLRSMPWHLSSEQGPTQLGL
jgi:hypothetical protein